MAQGEPWDLHEVRARYAAQRRAMIQEQIVARGIVDPAVRAAMQAVPREQFVPADLRARAYDDTALPLGPGQTISQPFIVAYMTYHLNCSPMSRVLEVGGGSGYQACVLGHLAKEVHTVEWDAALATEAAERAAALGLKNVQVHVGDGGMGWPAAAPYDRVLVTAACPLPPPPLLEQLAVGGTALLPVGAGESQTLVRIRKTEAGLGEERLIGCRFVKLIGQYGVAEGG